MQTVPITMIMSTWVRHALVTGAYPLVHRHYGPSPLVHGEWVGGSGTGARTLGLGPDNDLVTGMGQGLTNWGNAGVWKRWHVTIKSYKSRKEVRTYVE